MAITNEDFTVDWKIDQRSEDLSVLRRLDAGRWVHEAEVERYDGQWIWERLGVRHFLGDCDREHAEEMLWQNRGGFPPLHSHLCECEECYQIGVATDDAQ